MKKNIKVVELFAGVGGFRVGLERCSDRFKTIWANQWEPGKKSQHAYDCYVSHFGASPNYVNEDIGKVIDKVPEHDLLVGGFPCQDYSVARTGAKGIEGKKGVLWWNINEILKEKHPKYALLENVDRLIKSPASQRGRDFGMILRCFYNQGYAVEWRVINAADYGNAQRRRRTYIFAYKNDTKLYNNLEKKLSDNTYDLFKWICKDGFYSDIFPIENERNSAKSTSVNIDEKSYKDLKDVSDDFKAMFYNSGVMINGKIFSEEIIPKMIKPLTLRKIRETKTIDQKYFLNGSLEKWEFLKGSKRIERTKPNGDTYFFSEGSIGFPDDLDKPSRTMLTSESSLNRSTHVIEDAKTKKLRLLTPIECERLNGFDDNWTNTGMPEKFRYFVMGNALVVPIITKIGEKILKQF